MSVLIASSQDGDWVALYVNGVLKDQGHSLSIEHVLDAVDIPHMPFEVPSDVSEDLGQYPETLAELYAEVRRGSLET